MLGRKNGYEIPISREIKDRFWCPPSLFWPYCLFQDDILRRKRSKNCLIAIEVLSIKAIYTEEGKDTIYWACHCMFQSSFDKISKVEGYYDSVRTQEIGERPLAFKNYPISFLIIPIVSSLKHLYCQFRDSNPKDISLDNTTTYYLNYKASFCRNP